MAEGASLVCNVESTRCPVSADSTAMRAVSWSRISPTMITSGSARTIARKPVANVKPVLFETWIWVRPVISYSTGSSTVMMFLSGEFSTCRAAYSVVDLPDPVGPVTSTAPCASRNARSKVSRSASAMPSLCSSTTTLSLSSTRITIDSPCTLGSVTTRRSTWRPSTLSPTRPSCGRRRSAMSSSAMIFTREITPRAIRRGTVVTSLSTPSTRKRTRRSRPSGARWMSEAPRSTACATIWLTSLMTGASCAFSRRSNLLLNAPGFVTGNSTNTDGSSRSLYSSSASASAV